jgi:hypothetical protein
MYYSLVEDSIQMLDEAIVSKFSGHPMLDACGGCVVALAIRYGHILSLKLSLLQLLLLFQPFHVLLRG